ncbi:MAG: hypothetical protein AB7W28_00430 [Armatimonadota bacterium]
MADRPDEKLALKLLRHRDLLALVRLLGPCCREPRLFREWMRRHCGSPCPAQRNAPLEARRPNPAAKPRLGRQAQ